MPEDTIAAISTPLGQGGIGIVRISGTQAFPITQKIFFLSKKNTFKIEKKRKILYGFIRDPKTGNTVEEVLVSLMKGPKTYTREDIAEINCHGGFLSLRRVLEIILRCGARLAEPGEFTKRAFLNGRIDLIQAEAIADFIRSKTERSLQMSFRQIKGGLSKEIDGLKQGLKRLIAQVEAGIDHPEDDIKKISKKEIGKELKKLDKGFSDILGTADDGKVLREGIKIGIIGRPNVGKSSLLNRLLDEDRAIVTHIPGTTRDTLEEEININGIPLIIIDTAGIRDTKDFIEKEGVSRSRKVLSDSDLLLLVIDGSERLTAEDKKLLELTKSKKVVIVINKVDLEKNICYNESLCLLKRMDIVQISALKNLGIEALKKKIRDIILKCGLFSGGKEIKISNIRQIELLRKGKEFLSKANEAVVQGLSEEFISHDLILCLESLEQITGKLVRENIIEEIFSQFCLGK
ncbi:MAG: tRNA uridine-5-carboxymethylaminomethyl(34) synthesis GTPase MnmE [bacterium]|nr:tRNA uridine-5-carboxymethylaminomethyl(34) synthesis GTPase MnmE [bacterium]